MSMVLPSQGIRRDFNKARQVSDAASDEKLAAGAASSQMVVFAWIWTAVIAYFAFQAILG